MVCRFCWDQVLELEEEKSVFWGADSDSASHPEIQGCLSWAPQETPTPAGGRKAGGKEGKEEGIGEQRT